MKLNVGIAYMSNFVVLTEVSFIDVQHFLENLIEILGGKSPLE